MKQLKINDVNCHIPGMGRRVEAYSVGDSSLNNIIIGMVIDIVDLILFGFCAFTIIMVLFLVCK